MDLLQIPRSRRRTRPLAGLVLACALALLGACAAPASSSAALPVQGLYESCWPGQAPGGCAARLQRLGDAGFRLVIDYRMLEHDTTGQVLGYVRAARASGVQVLWPLSEWWSSDPNGSNLLAKYPLLAADCGCSTNGGLVSYIVGLAKNEPGTWGYYIADEPDPAESARLTAFAASVKAADPGHPLMIVACGICAAGDPTASRAAPFRDIDAILGTDQYPIYSQRPDPAYAGDSVGAGMKGLQRVADSKGRDTAVVLQAFNWSSSLSDPQPQCGPSRLECRFPTEQEMEAERNGALTNGHPRVILWFGLFGIIGWDPTQRPSDWTIPPDPEQRWRDLVQAAFAPEPAPRPTPPPVDTTPPPAGQPDVHPNRLAPVTVSYPVRGRRRLGRLSLTASFADSSVALDLRSSRLRLRGGHRYLVRTCITGGRVNRCRSRWYRQGAGRQRRGSLPPRVSLQVGRPAPGQADMLFSARLTVSTRGRHGKLVQVAASPLRVGAGPVRLRVPAQS